jgi:DNA-binding CsgD family transcriptional regulator
MYSICELTHWTDQGQTNHGAVRTGTLASMVGTQSWPLVGREPELKLITSEYDRMAAHGGGAGAVLVGAAGVGRTRLAREALDHLAARGTETTWSTATRSAAALPLGALTRLLDAASGADRIGALTSRFDDLRRLHGRPPVLAVDDAHLLDEASAAAVHHLAAGGHAFVLVTVRAGEPTPDAVTALWMDGIAARIDVAPLDDGVSALLAGALGEPLDPVSKPRLLRVAAGNPLLLRELLRASQETGALYRSAGRWRWTGSGYVTSRLRDVVRDQVGPVPDHLLPVVEPLALADRLPLAILVDVAGQDAVLAAERRGLVAVDRRSGRRHVARLAHPVHAEVVCTAIPRLGRRQVWARLADAIAETPRRRQDDVLLGALWGLRAGRPVPADELTTAARRALELARVGWAGLLAGAARRAGGGWLADLALAEAHAASGRADRAAAALPALAACPAPAAELRVRWSAADELIRYLAGGPLPTSGQTAAAWRGPLAAAAGGVALLAAGRCDRAAGLALRGYRQAVGLAAEVGDDAALLVAALAATRGIVATAQGRTELAISALTEATALLDGRPSFRLAGVCLAELAAAHALAGDTGRATTCLDRALVHPERPARLFDAWIERAGGWVAAATGDLTGAAARCRHAADLARATRQPAIAAYALYDAARFGDTGVRGELAALARELDTHVVNAMAGGALPSGAADLDRAAHAFANAGLVPYAAEAAFAAHRAHESAGRRAEARASRVLAVDLARRCDGARTPLLPTAGPTDTLTRRERHVATLAAGGRSGPKIAAELGLSVRTVNNHLGRIYAKLGISGRAELTELL